MLLVRNCMTPDPYTVGPDADIMSTFRLLKKHNFHQVPVVDGGKIVGIVTDRDLRTVLFKTDLKVADIMTPNPVTIYEDVDLHVAAQILLSRKFNAIPVVNHDGDLVGIITTHDVIASLLDALEACAEPCKVEVAIPEGVEFPDVVKVFQICCEKLLSFMVAEDKPDTYVFWVAGCDFDYLDRKLGEPQLKGVKCTRTG